MSQLTLAGEAEISTRHLSFLETGRAHPSREMVLLLGGVLDVPLRDRNALLVAAGYAPVYAERPLGDPALGQVQRVLDFMLALQEPYPGSCSTTSGMWCVRTRRAGGCSVSSSIPRRRRPPATSCV